MNHPTTDEALGAALSKARQIHLTEDELWRYVTDDLPQIVRARADAHLAGCSVCRACVQELETPIEVTDRHRARLAEVTAAFDARHSSGRSPASQAGDPAVPAAPIAERQSGNRVQQEFARLLAQFFTTMQSLLLPPQTIRAASREDTWREIAPGTGIWAEETENDAGDLSLWVTTERRDLGECRLRVTLGDWSAELHLARATPEAADLCGGVTIPAAVRRSAPERTRLEVEATEAPPAGE